MFRGRPWPAYFIRIWGLDSESCRGAGIGSFQLGWGAGQVRLEQKKMKLLQHEAPLLLRFKSRFWVYPV